MDRTRSTTYPCPNRQPAHILQTRAPAAWTISFLPPAWRCFHVGTYSTRSALLPGLWPCRHHPACVRPAAKVSAGRKKKSSSRKGGPFRLRRVHVCRYFLVGHLHGCHASGTSRGSSHIQQVPSRSKFSPQVHRPERRQQEHTTGNHRDNSEYHLCRRLHMDYSS